MADIKGWSKDIKDRIEYNSDGETIDELVMVGANVHLEQLTKNCFMLILDNGEHYWHLNIFSKSGKSKVDATMLEDGM